jgi:hypothetical protein
MENVWLRAFGLLPKQKELDATYLTAQFLKNWGSTMSYPLRMNSSFSLSTLAFAGK